MFLKLRVVKNLVFPEPAPRPHAELDHLHWDRKGRTWRAHREIAKQRAA
jgi:hypothetical protein